MSSIASTETVVDGAPDVVIIDGVSKKFVLRKDNSLKERLVTLGRGGRKHREEFWALRDVTTTIRAGETVALVGHNGSGKSTLLKVIGGIIDPSSGSVSRRGRIAALLELGAGFHPDLTGRENVFLNASIMGMSREETESQFEAILTFSGIGDFIDTQVKFYSSGMYVRLAFAVAVHTDPDLLLVDEVLAVGDEAFQRKCLDKIRSFQEEGRTIVLVTHNLGQVTELCDRALVLDHGAVKFDGDTNEAVTLFRELLEATAAAERGAAGASAEATIHSAVARAWGRDIDVPVELADDLTVDVELEHPNGTNDWALTLQIDNELGQVVYATSSRSVVPELAPLKGRRVVRFKLTDTRFGSGKYFVNISLVDTAGRHIVDAPHAASFTTAENELAVGSLYAEPSFFDDVSGSQLSLAATGS